MAYEALLLDDTNSFEADGTRLAPEVAAEFEAIIEQLRLDEDIEAPDEDAITSINGAVMVKTTIGGDYNHSSHPDIPPPPSR